MNRGAEPSEAKSAQAEPSEAKSAQAKSTQAKPTQAKSAQAKRMQAKRTEPARTSAAGLPLRQNWLALIVAIWLGQAMSIITSYAAGYAIVWYVTESTGSAAVLAAMNIAVLLPIGLISPFAGIVADKHNRKAIIIAADGGIGVISLIAAFVIMVGEVTLPLLLAVCIARAVGQAFHTPAMLALMPMLVPDEHLLRVNTIDQLLTSIASIGAPAFGIFLYTTLGFSSVLFLDFFGAVAAVLGLLFVKVPTIADPKAAGQHALVNLRDGWNAVSKTRGLVFLIAFLCVGMMIFAPLSAVAPLMTFDHFGGDGYAASIVEAAFGAGLLLGALALMIWGGGRRLAKLMAVAAVLVGVFTAACGLVPPDAFPLFVVGMAALAFACAGFDAPFTTLMQRNVPDEKMGRAMGLFSAAVGIASPVGVAIGGVLAEGFGVAQFFVIDGIACIVLGLVVYLPRSVRALDE